MGGLCAGQLHGKQTVNVTVRRSNVILHLCSAVILELLAFIFNAATGGQFPTLAQIHHTMMIEGKAIIPLYEIAFHRQHIRHEGKRVLRTHLLDAGIRIVQDQTLYAVCLECNWSRRGQIPTPQVHTRKPVPSFLGMNGAQGKVLVNRMVALSLLKREHGKRCKILVHLHGIVHQLIRCSGIVTKSFPFTIERSSQSPCHTMVTAMVIIAYREQAVRPFLQKSVWETTLIHPVKTRNNVPMHTVWTTLACKSFHAEVQTGGSAPVAMRILIFIYIIPVGTRTLCSNRKAQVFIDAPISRCSSAPGVSVSTLHHQTCPLIIKGRNGFDVHYTTHGIPAIKCILRTTQHCNTPHVQQREIVGILVQ